MDPSGTLYAGNSLRSTDYGTTWDSLSTAGAACSPLDMISYQHAAVLSAAPNIYFSMDDGQTWPILAYDRSAVFSIRPDSGQLMLYIAMSDGKLFQTSDGANTWQAFPAPSNNPVISMTASPTGLLFAVDSNLNSGFTQTWEYVPAVQSWQNITKGLRRQGFPDTAIVTNIWYVNGYAYAGTWNMGLFRSVKPVGPTNSVAEAEHFSPFHLYPNPGSSFVTLSFPPYLKSSGYRLFDLSGKALLRGPIGANATNVRIDIRGIPDGIYEVNTVGGNWLPAKLVVQH